ncbi:MAG: ATP-binding cassette domain-containing protein [Flavobacteriales bacterium]|nr:ATP-binding cassette domain-containing protein [Flavobacteriales bacterium]
MEQEPLMVQVQGVGKRYRLGTTNRQQLTDDVKAWTAKLLGRPDPTLPVGAAVDPQRIGEDFWALRDVSFEVRRGEVVGIVGHNGAGKSTMLKLLSRITLPTEGTIKMRGKVSSLLEVGTGFHPELTGRDNIYLNGAILGMRKAEVNAKLDEIIAFSGIQHHIDTPVKRYSSGMRVRLGFAIAAHLEPEILIVDEVLSVGDADFQRKSMGKMKDSAASGRTVLFVSHNMTAMRSLCSRVIWLDNGRVRMQGPTEDVVGAYLSNFTSDQSEMVWTELDTAPGNDVVRLRSARVRPDPDNGTFSWDTDVLFEVCIENLKADDGRHLNINVQVLNNDQLVLFATNLRENTPDADLGPGIHKVRFAIPGKLLNPGDFRFNLMVHYQGKLQFQTHSIIGFTLPEPVRKGAWHGKRAGLFRFPVAWQHERTSAGDQ